MYPMQLEGLRREQQLTEKSYPRDTDNKLWAGGMDDEKE